MIFLITYRIILFWIVSSAVICICRQVLSVFHWRCLGTDNGASFPCLPCCVLTQYLAPYISSDIHRPLRLRETEWTLIYIFANKCNDYDSLLNEVHTLFYVLPQSQVVTVSICLPNSPRISLRLP